MSTAGKLQAWRQERSTRREARLRELMHTTRTGSHLMVVSSDPDTRVAPSMLMTTETTDCVCPVKVALSCPEARSHTLHAV
jgi:hypothetical protein